MKQNPCTSVRKLVEFVDVSASTVQRIENRLGVKIKKKYKMFADPTQILGSEFYNIYQIKWFLKKLKYRKKTRFPRKYLIGWVLQKFILKSASENDFCHF